VRTDGQIRLCLYGFIPCIDRIINDELTGEETEEKNKKILDGMVKSQKGK
jgi:hypothetical protein